jgi:hypothetical protein
MIPILTIKVPGIDSGSLKRVVLQSEQKLLVILCPESATFGYGLWGAFFVISVKFWKLDVMDEDQSYTPDSILKLPFGIIKLLLKRPPEIFR